jgi:hypothetical protein
MRRRTTGYLLIAVAVTTVIWIVTVIAGQATAPPVTTLEEKIAAIADPGFLYYLTYVNAAVITVFTTASLAGLYDRCRADDPLWATVGLVFAPIYGIANLVAYLSQVFVVPDLLALYRRPETEVVARTLLGLTIQDWQPSAIATLNGLAYAMLGIPSIIFGLLLAREPGKRRVGGWLLALSGVLSFIALVGLAVDRPALAATTLVSGVVYLVAVVLIGMDWVQP